VVDTWPRLSGGTLTAGVTWLQVAFSEPVTGGDVAGNFQLQSLGPDNLLGTADDIIFPLTASYSGMTATLAFTTLPESVYRLTVKDNIADTSANRLDGDANGTAGGSWIREFVVVPGELGMSARLRCSPP